ncbi:glycosyltransferase family 2 protein [Peribacillus simplex]|uniref:glycosyltransferase family 2 protein n=1 Tax=Peribacillus simplex TaxID=1478 RepID=UPI0036D7B3DF
MKSSKSPLVSVIIATYKRPIMLKRAIDSVLNQTYEKIEVIVVDDNDPDTQYRKKTELLMANYVSHSNVKYIRHPKNINGAAARNTGIKNCSGDFVCFLDDDDWYLPEKTKKQVDYLMEHHEYNAVYCGWERNEKNFTPTKKGDLSFGLLSGTNLVFTNTIMMKKDAAINCGGWDARFRRNQEAVFLLKYFKSGYKMGVVNEILVKFDTSDRSNASNPQKNEEDFDFYLKMHEEQINAWDAKYRNGKKIIYSFRYRGVLLNYIKTKEYKGALKLYLKMMKYIPLRFNSDMFIYIKNRIFRNNSHAEDC